LNRIDSVVSFSTPPVELLTTETVYVDETVKPVIESLNTNAFAPLLS